jgi:hypothetical protein
MIQYEVIDNFLPVDQYNEIYNVIRGKNFPWYYSDSVGYDNGKDVGDWYMLHILFEQMSPQSQFFNILFPLIDKLQMKALIRAKVNFYPNIGKQIDNEFHRDQLYPHKGFIYYLNTNNGYTTLEDGTRIESVANRGVIFNSHNLHRGTQCTDQKVRYNINLNYF